MIRHNGSVRDEPRHSSHDKANDRTWRPLLIAGLALVALGLGVFGYIAWEFWGTNVVARHNQQQTADELVESWDDPQAAGLSGRDPREVPLGDAIALLRIPALGDDYVMPVVEGVRDDDLSRGVGHYPGTALPGQVGNFAVAGHRVTHGEPFRDLPDLEPGDVVEVETADAVYTYELDTDPADLVVQPDEAWVLEPVPPDSPYDRKRRVGRGPAIVTLMTCGEVFHTSDRMVGFGHLVDTEVK